MTIRKINTSIIGIQEGEERKNGTESLFKQIIEKYFSNI